ncbi:unnamed protein product [Lymnaea stagnalis]|uniref:BTB domain-containing protein n=1 Tax=Lymnaea stagnalis TaxID=6523 RepID=A0AAV2HTI0_LYMST
MASGDNLASCIVRKLGQLWDDNELSDIKIIIDDFQFNCHRFHLSACSEFFRVLLKSQTMEPSNDVISVTIKGLTQETFDNILISVYKGELTVTTDNMLDLWHASHNLQIDFLVNKLEHFISRNITEDNFFIIYKIAVELTSDKIIKSIQSFVAKNFEKISKTEEFLNLSYYCLLSIIGHDDLVLKSRDDLVRSVLNWMYYKPRSMDSTGTFQEKTKTNQLNDTQRMLHATQGKLSTKSIDVIFKTVDEVTYKVESSSQRKDNLGAIMKLIKLDDVSQDCLLTLLNNDDIIECREARTIVRQAFAEREDKKHLDREITSSKSSSGSALYVPSDDQQSDSLQVVEDNVPVVVYLQSSLRAILAYILDTRKTYSLPRNGLPRDGSMKNVYSSKNQLYILIGQSVGGKDVGSIYEFHSTGQWECLIEVPDGSHSFMFTNNYIYCIAQFQICRLNLQYLDSLVWVCVFNAPSTAVSFAMFEDKLIISHTTETEIGQPVHLSDSRSGFGNTFTFNGVATTTIGFGATQRLKKTVFMSHITYLDTVTWESCDDKDWISNAKLNFSQIQPFDFPIMYNPNIMKDDTYLLAEEGLLLQVTSGSDNSLSVTKEENVFSSERKSQPIVGAVTHGKVLFLFVNQSPGISDPTPLKLTSFDKIKVVPLVRTDSNCVPIKVPKQLLKIEV